jgi:hypothetical protein
LPSGRTIGKNAWEAGELILPDERQRLAFLEEAVRQLYQLLKRDEHWAAIAALADELPAHETLEAEHVREVLAVWMR